MQILIIDETTQGQLEVSQKIMALPPIELDLLDVRIKLATPDKFKDYLPDAALVIIGPNSCSQIASLAVSIQVINPHVTILVFADPFNYNREFLNLAQRSGAKKTLPQDASHLDVLQELVSVSQEHINVGRGKLGKIIAFAGAKGGAGVSSLVAGLGEYLSTTGQKSLLWDFDCDSRDLCRALCVPHSAGLTLNSWIKNNIQPSRDEFRRALFPAHEHVAVLPVPSGIPESLDFCYHSDCQPMLERLLELARINFDVTLIDLGSTNGASLGTILRYANQIVIMTGECPLSITACDFYASKIQHFTGNLERVKFLVAGAKQPYQDILREMQQIINAPQSAWTLPDLPNDQRVTNWPCSGKTIYSLGSKKTQQRLSEIADKLEINGKYDKDRPNNLHYLSDFSREKKTNSGSHKTTSTSQSLKTKTGGYLASLGFLKRA